MSDDPYVLGSSNNSSISALPTTYIAALSAIQEQSFIEATFDNPDYYEQLFTYRHKSSFIKVGFLIGMHDAFFILFGMLLLKFAQNGILHPFGHEYLTRFDTIVLFFLNTSPFLITFLLTFKTFRKITGVISQKMSFYLIIGFTLGALVLAIFLFLIIYWFCIAKCNDIYIFLAQYSKYKYLHFLKNIADIYWEHVRYILINGIWKELRDVLIITSALFSIYIYQIIYLKIKRNRRK